MRWQKHGLVFRPDPALWWQQSHASLPVPLHLSGDRYRIYFSSRDDRNRSHVGFFEVDLNDPSRVERTVSEPVLAPGPLGTFDDHGIYAASAVRTGDRVHLYTIGWNPGVRPPLFYASIGLAVSADDGVSFRKHGRSPIMARSDFDPCLVTSPVVLKEHDRWRMWYVSGYRWDEVDDRLASNYHIKYAESDDGICWRRDGTVCIDHQTEQERNIARCCVVRHGAGYLAWFSYADGHGYRIGFARSEDGIAWARDDKEAGLGLSDSGWDSEAVAYPYVIRHNDRWYMFYNGNGFGRDGIGLAVAS